MVFATGNQIFARVKRQFGDEAGVQVTADDLIMWLNDAMREAVIQNGSVNLKRVTIASVAGDNTYTFPNAADIASIHSVQYRDSSSAPYVTLQFASNYQMDELFPGSQGSLVTGTPLFYTTDAAGDFKVYPSPSMSEAAGFSVVYNSFFTEIDDLVETMTLSPRYYQYLLEYCLMKAYEMDENWEAADRKATFIQSTLNVLSSGDNDLNTSQYPVISSNFQDF